MENNKGIIITEFVVNNVEKILMVEKFSILIFAIGFILFQSHQPDLKFILIAGSILLAGCYFLYAFSVIDAENIEATGILNSMGFINFIYKITYFSLSISMIALMGFVIEIKKNSMLVCGGTTLMIVLILSLMTRVNDRSKIYNTPFYLRIVICLLLLSYLAVIKYQLV